MLIINKYITKKIVLVGFISLLAITLLLFFMQGSKYVDLIISKGVNAQYLIYITLLSMPSIWNESLPMMLFLSIIFTWHQINNNYEAVILQSLGLSPSQIYKPILYVSFFVAGLCFVLSLFVINLSYINFSNLRDEIKNTINLRVISDNKFMQLTPDTTIYVGKNDKDGGLKNILIDTQTQDKEYAIYAQSARLLHEGQTIKILLQNGSMQSLTKSTKEIDFLNFKFYIFNINLKPNKKLTVRDSPKSLYLWELIFYDKLPFMVDLKEHNFDEYKSRIQSFAKETNKRLINIMLCIFFAALTIAIFSRSNFSRKAQIKPILQSILIGAFVKILSILVVTNTTSFKTIIVFYTIIIVSSLLLLRSASKKYKVMPLQKG